MKTLLRKTNPVLPDEWPGMGGKEERGVLVSSISDSGGETGFLS